MQSGMLSKLRRAGKVGGFVAVALVLISWSPAPKEHVTLSYQVAADSKEQQALVREITTAFEKQFPHIHVEPNFEKPGGPVWSTKLAPDVFFTQADDLGQL